MKYTLPGLFVLLLVLSGCAVPGETPGDSASGEPGAIEHPTGSDPILVVRYEGGMIPIQFQVRDVPTLVLLGDGRVIVQGAQTLEFPGPALPALIERTLTEEGIQLVLDAIEETNLFTTDLDLRGAQNQISDASDTIFALNAGDNEVVVRVFALGMLDPSMGTPPGMSSSEMEAYQALTELNDALTTLDTWLPADAWEAEGWQPYEAQAFRLYVADVTGQPIEGGDLPGQIREWPTDDDPAAFGDVQEGFGDGTRCGVVTGDAGATWLAELNAANQNTLWTTDGDNRFRVQARPLLPHDEAICPDPFGA